MPYNYTDRNQTGQSILLPVWLSVRIFDSYALRNISLIPPPTALCAIPLCYDVNDIHPTLLYRRRRRRPDPAPRRQRLPTRWCSAAGDRLSAPAPRHVSVCLCVCLSLCVPSGWPVAPDWRLPDRRPRRNVGRDDKLSADGGDGSSGGGGGGGPEGPGRSAAVGGGSGGGAWGNGDDKGVRLSAVVVVVWRRWGGGGGRMWYYAATVIDSHDGQNTVETRHWKPYRGPNEHVLVWLLTTSHNVHKC